MQYMEIEACIITMFAIESAFWLQRGTGTLSRICLQYPMDALIAWKIALMSTPRLLTTLSAALLAALILPAVAEPVASTEPAATAVPSASAPTAEPERASDAATPLAAPVVDPMDATSLDGLNGTPSTPASPPSADASSDPAPATSAPAAALPVSQWTAELINQAEWVSDPGKGQFPVYAKAQILLDRSHASPGVVDGITGRNMLKAISAFELMQGLPIDGVLDAEVWNRLKLMDTSPVMQSYTLTQADIDGPYAKSIPHNYAEQAKMKGLYYTSVLEMLGEKFHMDVNFIKALNPGKDFNKVGETILVADPGPEDTRPLSLLIAHKGASELYGFDESGKMIVAYPATIGSSDTPSPTGKVKVVGIAPNPTYHYDPKNFVQAGNMNKLILPAGPNNPVGNMWIALSKKSYGIHGTPEPAKIDKTRSHGCVRLANWDAQALSKRIKPGITVEFRE